MSNWIIRFVLSQGVFGVGVLMLAENVVFFIPSELIMPLAGYAASQGRISFWGAVIAGTVGAHIGSFGWYLAGRFIPHHRFRDFVQRHGMWLALEPRNLQRAEDWFDHHGGVAVFTGRLLPAIRTFISIPAGFSKMGIPLFVGLSLFGTFVFNLLLVWAGQELGSHFKKLHSWIQPITWVVIGALFLWYVFRVIKLKRKQNSSSTPAST